MAKPRVPGSQDGAIELPCGETTTLAEFDMGMRDYRCACGETHAVVMDVHPPSRFFPESIVAVLRETIDVADDFGEFGTPHLMGVVLEEFPGEVTAVDASEDASKGFAMLWLTAFDSRRLHEVVVELVVELMEHAISHAEDESAMTDFETEMLQFDVAEFVEAYRAQRDFEDEFDAAL